MARTRYAVKSQEDATVESALFNPDVVFLLAALLDARDLCQLSQTCKTLGGKPTAYDGMSLAEEAARQLLRCATAWERSCLPKYDNEGWIELYHHLLLLRSKLTFDQLVGANVHFGDADQTIVKTAPGRMGSSCALCSNHVMRSGRHFAVFTKLTLGGGFSVQIHRSDFSDGDLDIFYPAKSQFRAYLTNQRTERWSDSNVHCCALMVNILNGTTGRQVITPPLELTVSIWAPA